MARFVILLSAAAILLGVVKEVEGGARTRRRRSTTTPTTTTSMPTSTTTITTTTTSTTTTTAIPRCPHNEMNRATRRAFLNTHNRLRSRLTRGLEFNGNFGYAPTAANIQKMIYDCTAEASALAHARTCDRKLSPPETRPGFKENFIEINKVYLTLPDAARHASQRWWKELSQYGVNPNMVFTAQMRSEQSRIVRHWGKMAWHNNVRLGCGIARCNTFLFVVCHYGPGGNVIGETFYTVGSPCSMCPGGTTCNNSTMLCEEDFGAVRTTRGRSTTTPTTTTTPTATNTTTTTTATTTSIATGTTTTITATTPTTTAIPRCPRNEMNHATRRAFLNTHNDLRSRLTRGLEFNGNFGHAPTAANMQKMRYDCNAEASALAHARTCDRKLSPPETRPGFKENFIEINKVYLTLSETARHASQRWWKELSLYGVNPNMVFTAQMRSEQSRIVRHWGKMAWHNNVRLGCGIARCNTFLFVVCHYGPGGNNIGETFYTTGNPCSMCPGGTTCNNSTMLCE